jgi:hypothetical protein
MKSQDITNRLLSRIERAKRPISPKALFFACMIGNALGSLIGIMIACRIIN